MALSNLFDASDFQRLDTSVHLNEYSRETVETRTPLDHFQKQFRRQKTTFEKIRRDSQHVPHSWDPYVDHVKRHLLTYRAMLPLTSTILQITLLAWLLSNYLALPINPTTGKRIRVGNLYSIFPFTSCIGSHHLHTYLGLKITILTLNAIATTITCYCGRDDFVAWKLRRIVWMFCLIVYSLGTWAVIASKEVDRTLHLFATAAELLSMYTLKGLSFSMEHVTRLRFRSMFNVSAVKIDTYWKIITMIFAFPLGIMTAVSIYMCYYAPIEDIQTKGKMCYGVMGMGAVSEWGYALTSVSWSASVVFELLTASQGRVARQRQEEEERMLLETEEGGSEGEKLEDVETEYKGDDKASLRSPESVPPRYSSLGMRDEEDFRDEEELGEMMSKPAKASLSKGSSWRGSGRGGYGLVEDAEDTFEEPVYERRMI